MVFRSDPSVFYTIPVYLFIYREKQTILIMWCLGELKPKVVDPIFDLEKVIHDLAWPRFRAAELATGCCGGCSDKWARKTFEMNIDWSRIKRQDQIIAHWGVAEERGQSGATGSSADAGSVATSGGNGQGSPSTKPLLKNEAETALDEVRGTAVNKGKVTPPKKMCVFETKFHNTTDLEHPQHFNFTFTKEIETTNEMSVTEGFSIGGELEFKPEIKGMAEAGGSMSIEWCGEKGQVLQDTNKIEWTLDSQIQLDKNEEATVAAYIRESEVQQNVIIESTFDLTSFNGKIAVDVRRRKDKRLFAVQELACKILNEHPDCKDKIIVTPKGFKVISEAVVSVTSVSQDVSVSRIPPTSGWSDWKKSCPKVFYHWQGIYVY